MQNQRSIRSSYNSCDSCVYILELMTIHPNNPDVNFGSVTEGPILRLFLPVIQHS